MRRFAGVVVVLLALAVSPADAQTYLPYWSPDTVEVGESSGNVVLTLGKSGPGPVRYRTNDGRCSVGSASSDSCEPGARAPEDYGAVSGEVIFTEAGSRQITVPVVDDGLDEGHSEAFTVYATEVDERGSWMAGTKVAVVWIIDDDGDDAGEPPTKTATAPAGRRSSTSSYAKPSPRSDDDGGAPGRRSATASATGTPSNELQPGPGFELTNEEAPEPAPGRASGGGGSAPWLALGLGAAAVSAGAIADARRRMRWSPTQV